MKSPYLRIALCFAISRILYFAAGIRFQTDRIAVNFQFLDLALLRTRLWETLYYCHGQPPLMNAIVGVALKLFPSSYGIVLHMLYLALGIMGSFFLYRLMRLLDVSEGIATLITIAFSVSPGCVLFENYPLYEYEILFLLLLSGVLLFRLYRAPTIAAAFWFFLSMAALGWIRSLYHLYLLVFVAIVLCLTLWRAKTEILLGAALPILSLLALYWKNLVIFGLFGSSSWLGANMVVVTTHNLPEAERRQYIQEGKLPPLASIEPGDFSDRLRPFLPEIPKTGIPILDEDRKIESGATNTNSLVYLKADPVFREIAKSTMRLDRGAYLRSIAIAIFCYFLPPTDFFHFEAERLMIRPLDRAMNLVVYGQFLETTRKGLRELKAQGETWRLLLYTGTFLIVVLPGLLLWGLYLLWRGHLTKPQAALLAFLLFNILFTFGTTTLLSSFENNRYRFPTDPLYMVLFATLLQRCFHYFRTPRLPD